MGRLEILLSYMGTDAAEICRQPNAGSGTGHGKGEETARLATVNILRVLHRRAQAFQIQEQRPVRDVHFCLIRGACDKNVFDSTLYKRLKAKEES